jgi:hypothetical protein
MKQLTIILTLFITLAPIFSHAYMTENAIDLHNYYIFGNVKGTHNEFTKYSIANLDYNSSLKELVQLFGERHRPPHLVKLSSHISENFDEPAPE